MIADYKKINDISGDPQIYKGLKLYPIMLKDKKYLDLYYKIFHYPQHTAKSKKILHLSYLKFFLFSGLSTKPKEDVEDFLKYLTKQDVEIQYHVAKKVIEDINDINFINIHIGDVTIDESEFNDIREIVLKQNGLSIEYINQYDADLEDRLRSTFSDSDIDFYDEIWILASLMDINPREILENYTFYQFNEMLNRKIMLKQFDMLKPLEVSGQIEFKNGDKIKSYLSHYGDKGRYDAIFISPDKFFNKLQEDLSK